FVAEKLDEGSIDVHASPLPVHKNHPVPTAPERRPEQPRQTGPGSCRSCHRLRIYRLGVCPERLATRGRFVALGAVRDSPRGALRARFGGAYAASSPTDSLGSAASRQLVKPGSTVVAKYGGAIPRP